MNKRKKTKNNKPLVTLEQWSEKVTGDLAYEVFQALEDHALLVTPEVHRNMMMQFLASYVSAVCYRSLAYIPEGIVDKEEQYKYAKDSFGDIKVKICEAVAAGVGGGMATWSGKIVDYYCLIKVVPEPESKSVN